MCNGMLRHPFSVEHVTQMVRHVYGERVTFHSGDGEVAPGVTVHRVGGHSDGLQVVRVETARGPVVLASDAAHYYGNLHRRSPFPIVYNVGDMAQGWETVERLAGHPDRFIPGPRSDRERDLSARQRQGRRLRAAPEAVALVREVAGRQSGCAAWRRPGIRNHHRDRTPGSRSARPEWPRNLNTPRSRWRPRGLHQIEALLDLAEQQREIPALRADRQDRISLFPAQQARDQLLIERAALPVMRSRNSRRSSAFSTRSTSCRCNSA